MSYQHILVPVDGSDISLSAVRHAANIAKASNAELGLISVVVENPFQGTDFYSSPIMKEYFTQAYENANQALTKAKEISAEIGIDATIEVVQGDISSETVRRTAERYQTDLIVMGSHGRKGVQKFLLGSFAQEVLNQTTLPVMIVKN